MNFRLSPLTFAKTQAQAAVLGIYENTRALPNEIKDIDKALSGLIKKTLSEEKFTGELGKTLVLNPPNLPYRRLILVGLGKKTRHDPNITRQASAAAAKAAQALHLWNIAFHFPNIIGKNQPTAAESIAQGAILGTYQFRKYKKKNDITPLKSIILTNVKPADKPAVIANLKTGQTLANATVYARDLINEPASHITPTKLAEIAQNLAKENAITVKIYNERDIEKMGMGAYYAVAKGSDHPPRLIHLTYTPAKPKKHLVLVGKGITFDSGGLNIKPAEGLENMKIDMSGAALVLAIFQTLPKIKPNIKVTGIIAAAENMPSGHAVRPGDIVAAMDGQTIEVTNTDAEGRLTLADAMVYACRQNPDTIIDMATLTGNAVSALGQKYSALFANDEHLTKELVQSSQQAGEDIWQLPLTEEYEELIKSDIADWKNLTSVRYAGAITGALFIKQFVGKIPWAHIDLASIWQDNETPLSKKGATGNITRTIIQYIINLNHAD